MMTWPPTFASNALQAVLYPAAAEAIFRTEVLTWKGPIPKETTDTRVGDRGKVCFQLRCFFFRLCPHHARGSTDFEMRI